MDYSNNGLLPEGFEVRAYVPAYYPALEAFWNSNGLGGRHRGDTAAIVSDTLAAGGHLLLLTEGEGAIIGSSWLTNDKRRTYLHHFGISEPYRGRGFAKILLQQSMKLAYEDGYQVKIEVHRDNEVALHLYKKAGFNYLGDYDVYIVRELPGH